MNLISISYPLKYQFKIDPKYKVTKCGKVFNTRTNRQIKRAYNSGSIGYWIGKKFIILNQGSPLELIPKVKTQF